ncbi:MAG: ABC transporter ATP-binding protein [Deltaproteobacteria bacterium]|nr:ABC transporter ATP-binding protein [Deltaproteobacteria bacterium]
MPEAISEDAPAVEIRGLAKTYRKGIRALDGVDLAVPRGCRFGLLGPNGAGKSTLVKILISAVRPSAGSARLLGQDIRKARARVRVGYLPESPRFPRYLDAMQVCAYHGRLAGLRGQALAREVERVIERVGLGEQRRTRVPALSKGMRQLLGVAQALLGSPQLLVMDEPTDGVDPIARQRLRDLFAELGRQGATLFINSHQLAEVEASCDRVAVLHRGRILSQGPVAEIAAAVSGGGLRIRFRTGALPEALWRSLAERGAIREADDRFSMPLPDEQAAQPLIDELRAAGVPVYAIEPQRRSLEEAFLSLIREQEPSAPDPLSRETVDNRKIVEKASSVPPLAGGTGRRPREGDGDPNEGESA